MAHGVCAYAFMGIVSYCLSRQCSSRGLFKTLKWLPFINRVQFNTAILMFKSVNGQIRWCKCEQQKKKFKFFFSTVFLPKQQKK